MLSRCPSSPLSLQIAAKTLQLKRLKSDIQSVVRLAQEGNRRVHEEASKQMSEDQASYDLTKQQLTQEVAALKKAYQDMVDANRDKEQMLRKVCIIFVRDRLEWTYFFYA